MVFISHSSHDAAFVSELRQQLESFKLKAWVDWRELVAGNTLDKEIQQALAKQQQDKRFQVISLLLPGIEIDALDFWFDEEPKAICLEDKDGALLAALPQILTALGEQAPDTIESLIELEEQPLEELILELEEPEI